MEVVSTATPKKRLLCVRHGISFANEMLREPGNQWGDATFRDDVSLVDTRLSNMGRQRTQEKLHEQLPKEFAGFLPQVELVVVSPLTRCLETYQIGVEPMLRDSLQKQESATGTCMKFPPVVALPMLTERVYTTSDTGRPIPELVKDFPSIDFSHCPTDAPFWYTQPEGSDFPEWRPHRQGQWYGVPGEPFDAFSKRMDVLDEWLRNRKEKNIILVAHWGVLRHLSSGTEFRNAEARMLENAIGHSVQSAI